MPDETPIIPALLTGAAVYFGIKRQGNSLADLAKIAVGRVVDQETGQRAPKQQQNRPPKKKKKAKQRAPR